MPSSGSSRMKTGPGTTVSALSSLITVKPGSSCANAALAAWSAAWSAEQTGEPSAFIVTSRAVRMASQHGRAQAGGFGQQPRQTVAVGKARIVTRIIAAGHRNVPSHHAFRHGRQG